MHQTALTALKTRVFYLVVIGLGILGTVIGTAIASRGGVTAAELQENLIASCETTRSPLQAYFEGEITATERTDPALFPDIPPAVFERLIAAKVERLQALVDTFDPDTCADAYSD